MAKLKRAVAIGNSSGEDLPGSERKASESYIRISKPGVSKQLHRHQEGSRTRTVHRLLVLRRLLQFPDSRGRAETIRPDS